MRIYRRAALGLLGASATLTAASAPAAAAASGARFEHGIASGDPLADRVILWTRVTPAAAPLALPVRWHIAETADAAPIRSGTAEARAAADYTVKVDADGLKPGHDYVYWFEAGDTASPKGRFRTLPTGATADAVLAVVTCSNYPSGLFNAYDAVARLDRVDAVVHLGDYIYEYGANGYGAETAQKLGRIVDPPHDIVSLDDYRRRHALYKTDADLQAAHARAAFICVWDDHETANDSWTGGAENHHPESEGSWKKRKAAAIQAYFEWMPIRDPIPGKPWESINRSFAFGDLTTLLMVETRLLARSHQAGYDGLPRDAAEFARILAEIKQPEREMLGEPQRLWLEAELARSVKSGQPWQVIGNQVVMARVAAPDVDTLLPKDMLDGMLAKLKPEYQARVHDELASYRAGVPMDVDAWDGYPAARERLYETFRRTGARPVVLSGDSHAFWANELKDDAGRLVAVEYGTSSITSPSYADMLGHDFPLGMAIQARNPEVKFNDQNRKGFILLTLTHQQARGDYVAVSTIMAKPYETKVIARYATAAGAGPARLEKL
jgi:alkaline phosphatase D